MKDKGKNIIYIGKAKNLRKRVTSYFRENADHLPKVQKMVDHVYDYDYIVTSSEFEALVLECSLIKQHQPKYNILLKDDKGYRYIRISKEPYPRITVAKQRLADNATYIGPYTSGFVVKQSVDEVNRIFKLPQCKRSFPADFGKQRPCLYYYIKECSGVCKGNISEEDYQNTVKEAISFLKDSGGQSIKHLKEEMNRAAENLNFERAAELRDRISAIEQLQEKQQVVFTTASDQDVVAFARQGSQTVMVILKIRGNRMVDKVDFQLGEINTLEEARGETLLQYYTENQGDIPKQVALDGAMEDQSMVEERLSQLAGRKVTLYLPAAGEGKRLMDMAKQNAAEIVSFNTGIYGKDLAALEELARLLKLPGPPLYIEAYDISNMGSSNMVAGMVVFENGVPLKKAYKRFSIKTLDEQNDYGAMSEVLTRRMNRYMEEKDTGEGFGRLPDLILLDGGKGHVSTVKPIIDSYGLDIPVFGMVKDDRHRTRAIASEDGEIALKPTLSAYRLVYRIQEEVHRYSIGYQRQKHNQNTFHSSLTTIDGVGAGRAKALMKQFKTLKAMSQASEEELKETPGMTAPTAAAVYAYFHPPEESAAASNSLQKEDTSV